MNNHEDGMYNRTIEMLSDAMLGFLMENRDWHAVGRMGEAIDSVRFGYTAPVEIKPVLDTTNPQYWAPGSFRHLITGEWAEPEEEPKLVEPTDDGLCVNCSEAHDNLKDDIGHLQRAVTTLAIRLNKLEEKVNDLQGLVKSTIDGHNGHISRDLTTCHGPLGGDIEEEATEATEEPIPDAQGVESPEVPDACPEHGTEHLLNVGGKMKCMATFRRKIDGATMPVLMRCGFPAEGGQS